MFPDNKNFLLSNALVDTQHEKILKLLDDVEAELQKDQEISDDTLKILKETFKRSKRGIRV